jgi:septal ring factor EnvC (AmiA/AmiB activator)
MEFSETELDLNAQKIAKLEKELDETRYILEQCISSIKETQRYLIKLSYNQSDITKRIAKWPYIVVNTESDEQ